MISQDSLVASACERGSERVNGFRAALWVSAAVLALWVVGSVLSSSAQWGDHFEQFVWAHGIEWGYHKHPPLPTWMLAVLIAAFGPASIWANALAAVCVAGTGLFTYRVAGELFGRSTAALALLFWGLQQPFSNRSLLFNHNTVLMLTISATAWCLLRALRAARPWKWWLSCGLLAGCALLSKYQAAVPLAGLAGAAFFSGELEPKRARLGLLLATCVAAALFAPHVAWVFQHDFSTVDYATQQGPPSLSAAGRAWSVTSFLAQQVRLVLPALLFAALLVFLPPFARPPVASGAMPADRRQAVWLYGLVVFPLCATTLISPLFGLKLQNHWGYQALQFAGLWLAWRVTPRTSLNGAGWVLLALGVHATFALIGILAAAQPSGNVQSRQDTKYPARELAEAVRRDWQDDTACPLLIVIGPTFEAGMVSVYNGGTASVLEDGDFSKSPWIRPSRVKRDGAVYVWIDDGRAAPKGATRMGTLDVSSVAPAPVNRIHWAIVPPASCTSR